ncbi:putative E3 ubiquitin-protein ligase LIN-1 isoform X1 [Tanacetum coccineum]|uniref:E3 ubiquitin-protein ligase LIN-1 isoform X1 n=1 Tax=Tanacetum coccineum TaxID=301880 RepID=A0ABQ5G0F5_9ASTR
MSTTTTATDILKRTTTFLHQNASPNPDTSPPYLNLSPFLNLSPPIHLHIKQLNLASETLENAINTTSVAAKTSSLCLSEKLLLSFLEVLRTTLLVRQDQSYASLICGYESDENSVVMDSVVSCMDLLSKMNGDQALELKELEKEYEYVLDENCRIFVEYFKEVLENEDGDIVIVPPSVVLEVHKSEGYGYNRDEKSLLSTEFGSRNGRYNPIWTGEGQRSIEIQNNRNKTLSKFPSFFPERVSPRVFTNQRSSSRLSRLSPNNKDPESEPEDNSSSMSTSDSDAELEEENTEILSLDSKQTQSQKHKQPVIIESRENSSFDPLMEDYDNPVNEGKHTPPKDFVCPITTHIFNDPVTLETGQTYERKAIQQWLERGNSTCPITRQKLHNTQLPKTNYVLKRLIASWQELTPQLNSSPDSFISQAPIDGTVDELKVEITKLCTSEVLKEAETAVFKIERFWQDLPESSMELEIQTMLSQPPVINGFIEILFSSIDTRVLIATVYLLSELASRDKNVISTLTRVDSDMECVIALFKKGLFEAVVLIYLLKPSTVTLLQMEMADSLLSVVNGKCRNVIADTAELAPVLEIFVEANDRDRIEIPVGERSTIYTHTLLTYLQIASTDQLPIVAGLLFQLDLLVRLYSFYMYYLSKATGNSPATQIAAADTILALQGRFSSSGKPLVRTYLLKRAGLDKSYRSTMRKEQLAAISGEVQETMEEEKAAEEWERKAAFVLVSHEFGLIFEALSEGLKSRYAEVCSASFVSAIWLVHMLTLLPDTGLQGAARICLLNRFVSIFKSAKDTEDKALSCMLLQFFISIDPDGLREITTHMKDILKGIREFKKSSTVAFEMLKVFSEGNESSADLWNHKELTQQDCSTHGEVLSIVCIKDKIVSGHSDGTIKVWTGKGSLLHPIQEVREHSKAVTSLTVLQSGDTLYSGSHDKTVRGWSINKEMIQCEQVYDVKDHVNNLLVANSISCFIPQGAGIKIHSWSGTSKLLNTSKYVKCLALVHGRLYSGCQDNSIQEIDLATGTLSSIQSGSRKLIGKSTPVHALKVHDGLVYSAGSSIEGTVLKVWNASNYNLVQSVSLASEVRTMVISSDMIYMGCKGGTVEVWCRKKLTRKETLQTGTNCRVICMALDSNEDLLVVGTSDGRIQAWGKVTAHSSPGAGVILSIELDINFHGFLTIKYGVYAPLGIKQKTTHLR